MFVVAHHKQFRQVESHLFCIVDSQQMGEHVQTIKRLLHLYVTRIQKRLDLKDKLLYHWDEDTTFATLTRAKIEKSMQDADHFNATQLSEHLPEKETNHHGVMPRIKKQRPVPYVIEQVKSSKD